MPRASAEVAAETARQVLVAATTLFAVRGYAAVSLEGVAEAAGVTRGAVYHHYRNKAGLFEAVAEQAQVNVAAAVEEAAEAAGDDPESRLRAGSQAFLDAITDAPFARILLQDAPAVIGWARWRDLDAANSMTHLREALADLGVPASDLTAMTVQLSGAMNEAAQWLAEHPEDVEARAAARRTLDRLLSVAVG